MGREIKRVALDFDWPLFEIWPGYSMCMSDGVPDRRKNSDGTPKFLSEEQYEKWSDYFYAHQVEPPAGDGWQVWETVSEGSPITPVFATKEGLVDYLQSENYNWGISRPMTKVAAEAFVDAGWVLSGMIIDGNFVNGENIPYAIKMEEHHD